MLVLSRKKNESIIINNDITIVVVEIRGDKVRLGVEAPKEVPVHRREVYDAIKRGEQEADPKTAAKLLLAISLRIAARMRETADKVKLYAQLTQAMQQEIDALMPT